MFLGLAILIVLGVFAYHRLRKGRSRIARTFLRVIGAIWSPMGPPMAQPRPRQKVGSGRR